jgi:hypothetical protein
MAKIIYEPHPISPARKAKLQAEGYKIIDAIFAPAGAPIHKKLDTEDAAIEAVIAAETEEAPVAAEAEADIDEAIEKLDEAVEEYIVEVAAKRKRSKKV